MLRHNFLLAYRTFKRFKGTFFINLVGLSVGMACALLIYLWVMDELRMDQFHANGKNICQVMMMANEDEGKQVFPNTPGVLAETLAEEFPEVKYASAETPTAWFTKFTLVTDNGTKIKATSEFADKDYFNIFSFQLLQGDQNQVLKDVNSVVISDKLARSLFQTTDNVVGKTLQCESPFFLRSFTISGIFRELPANSSHQRFDFVLPFKVIKEIAQSEMGWASNGPSTYMVLKDGTNLERFNAKIANYLQSKRNGPTPTLFARRYVDGYLYDKYENGVVVGGRIEYVRLFSIIAVFILLIACINFINLSTAKASRRLKEVGIKKAIGAGRGSLILQYLGESMLLSFVALLIAVVFVLIFLPAFHLITGKDISVDLSPAFLLTALGVMLFTGIAAGSYPALYLSNFNPAIVLKGKVNNSAGEQWMRKGLVVFQFTLSVIFIVSVLVVYKQMQYVQTKNLGYDKEHLVSVEREGKLMQNSEAFIREAISIPGVVNASSISHDLLRHNRGTTLLEWEGKDENNKTTFEDVSASYDLIETLDIKVKEGRAFSRKFGIDSAAILFNETAIKAMGLKDPVGKVVRLSGGQKQIIGVIKDFHFESLHQNVKPLFITLQPNDTRYVVVRLGAGKHEETLGQLARLYQRYNPEFSFNYKFLDQNYEALYGNEQRVSVLSRYFATIAVLISCLGLFGLAAFTAERRVKEISIRKVYGASNMTIMYLLSSSFTKMVLLSIVLALPVSYFIARGWLSGFVYRISLEPWYFLVAGLLTLGIALLTVSIQTVKAANANPLRSLKDQ